MHIVFEDQRRAVIADRRIEVRKIAQDFAEGTDQQYYGRQLRVRMRLVPFAPPGFHLRHIDIVMMRHMRNGDPVRSEAHTSELQSLMRISYAGFGLQKEK